MISLNILSGRDDDFTYNGYGYTSPDPRLISSAHNGQKLILDFPPLNGKVMAENVYKPKPGYCHTYSGYNKMTGGQIGYYIDESLAKPFISPLFVDPNKPTFLDMYIDPMGTVKPHFLRQPGHDPQHCKDQLTWIRDSTTNREDIMSKQLWKRNQNSYQVLKMYGRGNY